MRRKLFVQAITKFLSGMIVMCFSIFLPAGTLFFANGWLLIGLLFVPMFFAGIVMIFQNPELLKKRLKARETKKEQKTLIAFSGLMFLTGYIVAGLTVRFHWYTLPREAVMVGTVAFLAGYLLYAEVLRENTYLSRIIEVQENQKVVDTGLYSVVRHPMYSATLFLFLSMPLILGSLYALLIFLSYPFIIVQRIKREELFLEKELAGYCEYKQKVKYRLIPFVW